MRSITCLCDKSFDAEVPESVDLDADPGLLVRLGEGEFMAFTCPHCGAKLKPEFAVRVKGMALSRELWVLPELERLEFYSGKADLPAACEVLVGYPELFERARLVRDGVDPEAAEILKFYLLGRAGEENPEAELAVFYMGKEPGRLVFHLYGAREGETGVLRIPEETFREIAAGKKRKMGEDTFREIFKGPYRSVRSLEALAEEE
ncbi:MAG TPA: CpXC domain-containing protein [Spirochaetales bacterium]|nr:CpXC domain-containing protein [Spirochaetales bacterium]